MSAKNEHIVDIGDDAKGIECRCLATGCGWRFVSEDAAERRIEAHRHVSEAISNKT